MTFQLLTAQHQLSMCLVVELRGDVEALGFGELVAGYFACSTVRLYDGSRCQSKIRFTYFLPCRFHVSNGPHHVLVLFTSQLGNNTADYEYFSLLKCVILGEKVNLFSKRLSTTSGKEQKTVNRNQEKTVIIVKVVKVKVVKLNSEQGVELTIKYNF